jgi:NAD(P)-dependent dehydrogenase (short-subunit alcohol dehydrogenase family)
LDAVSSKLFQTNVIGNIHLFNLFLPLVMKGKVKKVITISSGHADLDFINSTELETSALYAASKAAMNVIVAKFNAQYKKDGVLFVSVSPGVVEVGHFANRMHAPAFNVETSGHLTDMYIHSHSRTNSELDSSYEQACDVCASLQGHDACRRSYPD